MEVILTTFIDDNGRRVDKYCTLTVREAVISHQRDGDTTIHAKLLEQGVPEHVVLRVLSGPGFRRKMDSLTELSAPVEVAQPLKGDAAANKQVPAKIPSTTDLDKAIRDLNTQLAVFHLGRRSGRR